MTSDLTVYVYSMTLLQRAVAFNKKNMAYCLQLKVKLLDVLMCMFTEHVSIRLISTRSSIGRSRRAGRGVCSVNTRVCRVVVGLCIRWITTPRNCCISVLPWANGRLLFF